MLGAGRIFGRQVAADYTRIDGFCGLTRRCPSRSHLQAASCTSAGSCLVFLCLDLSYRCEAMEYRFVDDASVLEMLDYDPLQ